ncbi:MAG: hypothetical protein ACTSXA_13905 [Candidatus Heimdallarchaeota archaeon]
MNKKLKITLALVFIGLTAITLFPTSILGWASEDTGTSTTTSPRFSTTQWLSYEAMDMFPEAKVQWITDNIMDYWHGVEAPFNADMAVGTVDPIDYGDDYDSYVLYLDAPGTSVTNGSLAVRAQEEYVKLVAELSKVDANYSLAAFYAGAMTYYITQAGYWATVWDESLWGALNTTRMAVFEAKIEASNAISSFPALELLWEFLVTTGITNNGFDLNPTQIASANAWNATVDLAMAIFPIAESIGDDFNDSSTIGDWETTYYDNVFFCLESSVEAAYAALEDAMTVANLNYITLPVPTYTFDSDLFRLTIPEFDVTITNSTGTYILNETLATESTISYLYYDQYGQANYLSTETMDLSYNGGSGKWYMPATLVQGAIIKSNHSIMYNFDMIGAPAAYSNLSSQFHVDYYNVTIEGLYYSYNTTDRTLDINNISANCFDIPDIGLVEPAEVESATWILYQKGLGATQTGDVIGVPTTDTQNNAVAGNLTYNISSNRWYSNDNDIGWVFTPTSVEYYVVARFLLIIPVGFVRLGLFGTPVFKPYAQQQGTHYFRTRDHQVTISKPIIEFDLETFSIEIWNITAVTDYQNVVLDEYEVREKEVYGEDIRQARWKVFLWDGIASHLTGNLIWNEADQYWFADNISVDDLPDNNYYISAKITNMNINFTVSPWGPASNLFEITRPIPVIYWILPEFFMAGFVVLFGWLAWWRPKKKREMIERERAEKIHDDFKD